jgi:hypothetical protein
MALAYCRECGGKVSTEVAYCPHCGAVSPAGHLHSPPPQPVAGPLLPPKHQPGCFSIGCGGLAILFVIGLIASAGDDASTRATTSSIERATVSTPERTPEQSKAAYMVQIERELVSVRDGFDGSTYRGSTDAVNMEVVLFGTWGKVIGEARSHALTESEKAKVTELRGLISQIQIREFPRMRAAWAEKMRTAMWEHDVSFTTGGTASRTIRLSASIFASNANIQQVQQGISEQLTLLRFRRVEYRWYRGADDYQYYTLQPPPDGAVREITSAGWSAAP